MTVSDSDAYAITKDTQTANQEIKSWMVTAILTPSSKNAFSTSRSLFGWLPSGLWNWVYRLLHPLPFVFLFVFMKMPLLRKKKKVSKGKTKGIRVCHLKMWGRILDVSGWGGACGVLNGGWTNNAFWPPLSGWPSNQQTASRQVWSQGF